MKLINRHKRVELKISQELLDKLVDLGLKQHPNEFGGFLIGHYSDNLNILYVSDFLLPRKYISVPYIFERSIDGVKNIFEKLFNEKKQYYVGEWHTHPNGTTRYSQTDLQAMIEIEKCQTVKIKNPVLLILSIDDKRSFDFTFYLYNNGVLTKYE